MSPEGSGEFLLRTGRTVPGDMALLIDAMNDYQRAGGTRVDELYVVYKAAQKWKSVSKYR